MHFFDETVSGERWREREKESLLVPHPDRLFNCHSPRIHHRVLVVSAVEKDAAWEHEQTAEEQQQHLQTLLAAVHKVTVEDVRVLWRRQAILRGRRSRRNANTFQLTKWS